MIIAVDFDGTLVQCPDNFNLDEFVAVPNAVEVVGKLLRFHYVYIWTVRCKELGLDSLEKFLADNDLKVDGINYKKDQYTYSSSPKLDANIYIDDKALGCPIMLFNKRPVVNWWEVEKMLTKEGYL